MTDEYDAVVGSLAMLIGGKVIGLVHSLEDGDMFWGLEISVGKEIKTIWFLSDFEGNGPGGWDIQ